jgi:hypothetical protein
MPRLNGAADFFNRIGGLQTFTAKLYRLPWRAAHGSEPNLSDDELVKEMLSEGSHPYTLAVGRLAFAWNSLHETLASLFARIATVEAAVGYASWYSIPSDRTQREMLKAAVEASTDEKWISSLPSGKEDLRWVVDRTNSLADQRNDAVHAPVQLALIRDRRAPEQPRRLYISPNYLNGNPRAKKLKDKDIIREFDRYTRNARALNIFAEQMSSAWVGGGAWPRKRPQLR